jgi:hypothetical protein
MKTEKVYPLLPVQRSDSDASFATTHSLDELPQWKFSFWRSCFGLSEEENKYQEFMSNGNSLNIHLAVGIIGSLVHLIMVLETFLGDFPSNYNAYIYQRIFMFLALWLHLYSIVQKKHPGRFRPLPIDIIYLGDAVMLSYAVTFGVFLYGMATAEGCDLFLPPHRLMCDNYIPIDSVIVCLGVDDAFSPD